MFEQTFVDGVGKTKRPYTILLSFAVQIVAIGVLVIIPLIFYDTLKGAVLTSALVAPAPPPPPPPPPPPQAVVKVIHTAPKQFIANQLIAPKSVPSKILMVTEEEAPLSTGVIGGIPGGVPGSGGGLSGLMGGLPAAAPPKPASSPAGSAEADRSPKSRWSGCGCKSHQSSEAHLSAVGQAGSHAGNREI